MVNLDCYEDGWDLENGLKKFIMFYNRKKLHQYLGYNKSAEIYFKKLLAQKVENIVNLKSFLGV